MSLAPLRRTIRRLVGSPMLALAAIVTLGVSIGAATAIYSAVQAVLLGPLPFRDVDGLVVMWETDVKKGALLIVVGLGGGLVAARRALAIQPAQALRKPD